MSKTQQKFTLQDNNIITKQKQNQNQTHQQTKTNKNALLRQQDSSRAQTNTKSPKFIPNLIH